jgi:hypothetical protein
MAVNSNNFTFPRTDIPKAEKENETYHKNFALAILNSSINTNYDVNYAAMDESVTFFNGDQGGDRFKFMQSAADGETLPAEWITFNRIKSKFEILFGELMAKGYQINAESINKDAKARKLAAKQEAKVNLNLREDRVSLEKDIGLSLAPQGKDFEDEEEINLFFDYNFKEKHEVIMEYALRFLAKKHKWNYTRLAAYRDLMIQGRLFYKVEIVDGLPFIRRIDPRLMLFDVNATDDFLSDSSYFGEIRYMPMADVASKYSLTEEEVKTVYGEFGDYRRTQSVGPASVGNSVSFSANGSNLEYFRTEGNELRVLVMSGVWMDQETIKHRETVDNYGGEHLKEVSDTASSGKLTTNTIAQWRKATIIGAELVKDWGVLENSVRANDALAESSCPYKALIPSYMNQRSVSKVDQIKGLQNVKDMALYNLQLEMTTAGRKGFIYDVSQLPENWDIHTTMKYLKTAGIAFIDSNKSGIPSTHNQFQKIDQTISDGVVHYMNIARLMDEQMDAITGINEARQGQISGANQGLGVTQSALIQSNMATKVYEELFRIVNEMALNHQAGLVKLSFAGNEKYAPIIGDVGINFLEQTVDLELDDFGVFMEETPPLLDDLVSFREIVKAAMSAGQLDFVNGVKLLTEKDIIVGIERFEAVTRRKEKEAAAANQQAMAQQAQAAEAAKKQEHGSKEVLENIKGDYQLERQREENKGDMNEIIAKGKIDSGSQNINAQKDILLSKLKSNAEARDS